MISFYEKNLIEYMKWTNIQYSIFYIEYKKALIQYRPGYFKDTIPFLYDENYLKTVLSLYFVYSYKLNYPEPFLISLLLNGLFYDKSNLFPSLEQTVAVRKFLDKIPNNVISETDKQVIEYYLSTTNAETDRSDLNNDVSLLNDFRFLFCCLRFPEFKAVVSYCINIKKMKYKCADDSLLQGLNVEKIREKMFNIYTKITNPNLKEFYFYKIENLENTDLDFTNYDY